MAFGTIMELDLNESVRVQLAPLSREDMPLFISDGGMQSHEVIRYLGRRTAPVLEDEYEWFDKTRQDETSIVWGIYILQEGKRELIGTTALHQIGGEVMKRATSGCLIFKPEWWGKGVASRTHRARSWYGFTQAGLVVIRSAHLNGNVGSQTALDRAGYAEVGIERNMQMVDGVWQHHRNLECVNPAPWAWRLWWGNDQPPKRFREARVRTTEALAWAEQHVRQP